MSTDRQMVLPGESEGYRTVLADPPWMERGGGKVCRGAQRHYPLMDREAIWRTMAQAPCWRPHRDGCHLWMWATSNHLPDALWVIEALNFRYVTSAAWVKMRRTSCSGVLGDSVSVALSSLQIGIGQYMRHCHELLLLARRGRLPVPAAAHRPPSVIITRRKRHSEKPEEQYALIEAVSSGPRLEMFARGTPRPGWNAWGDEACP